MLGALSILGVLRSRLAWQGICHVVFNTLRNTLSRGPDTESDESAAWPSNLLYCCHSAARYGMWPRAASTPSVPSCQPWARTRVDKVYGNIDGTGRQSRSPKRLDAFVLFEWCHLRNLFSVRASGERACQVEIRYLQLMPFETIRHHGAPFLSHALTYAQPWNGLHES